MNPEQAIALLDSIARNVAMSREDHAKAVTAVRVLRIAIAPKPEGDNGDPA